MVSILSSGFLFWGIQIDSQGPGGIFKIPPGPQGLLEITLGPQVFSSHWLHHASTQPKGCQRVAKELPKGLQDTEIENGSANIEVKNKGMIFDAVAIANKEGKAKEDSKETMDEHTNMRRIICTAYQGTKPLRATMTRRLSERLAMGIA